MTEPTVERDMFAPIVEAFAEVRARLEPRARTHRTHLRRGPRRPRRRRRPHAAIG